MSHTFFSRLKAFITSSALLLLCPSLSAITVTSLTDDGGGDDITLREAITNTEAGGTIDFDPALNGETITLNGTELIIDKQLTVDASTLPDGITIDADKKSRIFHIAGAQGNQIDITNSIAEQSSELQGDVGFTASNAIDGILTNSTHTATGENGDEIPSLTVTLAQVTSFSTVRLHNRGDNCCQDYLQDIIVELLDFNGATLTTSSIINPDNIRSLGNNPVTESKFIDVLFPLTQASQIKISRNSPSNIANREILSLGEVEIFTSGVNLKALTLINGITSGDRAPASSGGAIYAIQSDLSLNNCTLSRNTSPIGGSIFCNGKISLNNCTLKDNSANFGGSIYSESSTHITLSNCVFSNNSADLGGSIHNESGNSSTILTLNACTFSNDFASNHGGSLYTRSPVYGVVNLTLTNCTFSNNSSGIGSALCSIGLTEQITCLTLNDCTFSNNFTYLGGVIANRDSNLTLNSCTVSNNTTKIEGGGGISAVGGTTNINHSTFSKNSTREGGGGIHIFEGSALILNNSIVSGNSSAGFNLDLNIETGTEATLPTEVILTTGTNLIGVAGNSGLCDKTDGVIINENPHLAPLGHYGGPTQTMPPLPGSPAINAAGSINPGGLDQRGFNRFVGSALDIGAVEFQGNNTELNLAFNEDIDGDGTSVGVELAIGSDPFIPNSNTEKNLHISFNENALPQFTFGLNNEQQNNIILRLMRSTDLVNFDEEVFNNETPIDDFGSGLFGIQDNTPPISGKVFYRLEAERRP